MPALFSIEQGDQDLSWVHRLDVRTKMGMTALASLAVVAMNGPAALGLATVASVLYALSLKRYKILLTVYLLVALMGVAAMAMMAGMHALWPQTSALEPVKLALPFLRTAVVLNVSLAMALSSSSQSLMATLKHLRLPFTLYVPLSIMIRFVPTFVEDVRQITECLRTRGHRLTPAAMIFSPKLTVRLLLMPMLFRSMRSADELGIAAELKGLGAASRLTPLAEARFRRVDLLAATLTLAVLAAATVLQIALGDGPGGLHL